MKWKRQSDRARKDLNREYMRRWRADPRNHEREMAARAQANYLRKLRAAGSHSALSAVSATCARRCA